MGRSMTTGNDPSLLERLPAPFTVFDNDAGEYFEVLQKKDGLYQSQYAMDRDGKEVFRQTWRLAYVVGSGENGFGFLVQRGDYLFEAPLSYYTKSHVWSFSPGYELHNYAFTRPALAECVGCHAGRPRPVYDRAGLYREPPFAELAVGCENCHGPGELHVAERRAGRPFSGPLDTSIVNPARLSGWLADNICMKCHQGGDVRVEQPGKHAEDFRPGTPLDRALGTFKVPLNRDSSSHPVLLEHYFSMTLSKCYRASGGRLRCATCHNPHVEPPAQEATSYYRAKCLTCHDTKSCKLTIAERQQKNGADDCASCHMLARTVATITHAALTDHRISARPDEPYPEEAFQAESKSSPGLLHLTARPGETDAVPSTTLLQAYAGVIHEGHDEFRPRMTELLDRLATDRSDDPLVLSALARRAIEKHDPKEAINDLEQVIRAGSASREDFLLLADLYSREHRNPEAIRVLEKGMQANPYSREFPDALAVQYITLGQYGRALGGIRKGLEKFPDDVTLRLLEKKVRTATLDGSLEQ